MNIYIFSLFFSQETNTEKGEKSEFQRGYKNICFLLLDYTFGLRLPNLVASVHWFFPNSLEFHKCTETLNLIYTGSSQYQIFFNEAA